MFIWSRIQLIFSWLKFLSVKHRREGFSYRWTHWLVVFDTGKFAENRKFYISIQLKSWRMQPFLDCLKIVSTVYFLDRLKTPLVRQVLLKINGVYRRLNRFFSPQPWSDSRSYYGTWVTLSSSIWGVGVQWVPASKKLMFVGQADSVFICPLSSSENLKKITFSAGCSFLHFRF